MDLGTVQNYKTKYRLAASVCLVYTPVLSFSFSQNPFVYKITSVSTLKEEAFPHKTSLLISLMLKLVISVRQ